jgi:ribose transport system ATP-binding protein
MKDGAVVAEHRPVAEANVTATAPAHGRPQPPDGILSRNRARSRYRDEVVLEADGLALGHAFRNVDFKIHAGEILGIAGVIGSGREELSRTLAGFMPQMRR